MTSQKSADDPFAALRDELLNVEPSAGFTARVAAAVVPRPAAARPALWFALACAAAIALVAFAAARRGVVDRTAVPVVATADRTPPGPPAAAELRAAPRQSPRLEVAEKAVARRVSRASTREASDPFAVITTQGDVLNRLWQMASETREPNRGELPATKTLVDADGLLQVPELVVDPIVVMPIGGTGAQGRSQRMVSPQATGSPR